MELLRSIAMLLISVDSISGAENKVLSELMNTLFKGYDPGIRPYCFGMTRVNVTMDLGIRQVIDVNEPQQIMKLNVWIRLIWIDCHLSWNPAGYENISRVAVPYDKIWVPDLVLYDSVADEFHGLTDYRPKIYSNGTIAYNFPTVLQVQCPVDVTEFPYDDQLCILQLGSWIYDGFEVDIDVRYDHADLTAMTANVEWDINKVTASRHVTIYRCCPEPFPDVRYYVYLTRKPRYYESNLILPPVIITLIASLGFILPVESGEKVALEVTIFLSLIVFQLVVADKLPPSAEARPWVGHFFSLTLFLCGFTTLVQVLVINIFYRGNRKMPNWMKRYILKPISVLTLTKAKWKKEKGNDGKSEDDTVPVEDVDNFTLWQLFSICIDRIGLVLFLFTFTVGSISIFTNLN